MSFHKVRQAHDVGAENLAYTCSFKQTLGLALPCKHLPVFYARSYLQLTTFESIMVAIGD